MSKEQISPREALKDLMPWLLLMPFQKGDPFSDAVNNAKAALQSISREGKEGGEKYEMKYEYGKPFQPLESPKPIKETKDEIVIKHLLQDPDSKAHLTDKGYFNKVMPFAIKDAMEEYAIQRIKEYEKESKVLGSVIEMIKALPE